MPEKDTKVSDSVAPPPLTHLVVSTFTLFPSEGMNDLFLLLNLFPLTFTNSLPLTELPPTHPILLRSNKWVLTSPSVLSLSESLIIPSLPTRYRGIDSLCVLPSFPTYALHEADCCLPSAAS